MFRKSTLLSNWFGSTPPPELKIGSYNGSGIGLSTGGDQVNLYNTTSNIPVASILFGTSPSAPYTTFDNAAGTNGITTTLTQMSAVGVNGAFVAANSSSEIGSPGIFKPNTTLATEFPQTANAFKVVAYPVPFSSHFQLDIASANTTTVSLSVYDMTGRLLEKRKIEMSELQNQMIGENYASGIYNLVITQANNSNTIRVIKK